MSPNNRKERAVTWREGGGLKDEVGAYLPTWCVMASISRCQAIPPAHFRQLENDRLTVH